MVRPIEPPGRIACDPIDEPTTRLALLEYVNELNIQAVRNEQNDKFWTVTVLYNTVVYRHGEDGTNVFKVFKGVLS